MERLSLTQPENLRGMAIEQGQVGECVGVGIDGHDLRQPTGDDDAPWRIAKLGVLRIVLQLPHRSPGHEPEPRAHVDFDLGNRVGAGHLDLPLGREGQRALEVIDRVVEVAHPVVVVEHRALDVEVLPERAAESGLVIEHRSATSPPIGYAQFVDALLTGDAASAIDEVRDLRGTQSTNILLNDFYLYRLAYGLLYSWGLSDEAMQLSKLNVELNPSSTLAAQGLSMSYVDRRDYAAAIEVYRRLLELNPDDNNVKRTLEWLQGQGELSKRRN